MKKYTVIKYFTDLQDSGFAYHEGDAFPREGLKVSEERLEELSTSANRRKQPLIKVVDEVKEEPKEVIVEDIPEENTEKPKEEPQKAETGSSTAKSTKAKKSGKKS